MSFNSGVGGGLRWSTAIALVLIAVGITWTVVAQSDDSSSAAPAPTPTPDPTPSAPPAEGYESSCGLSGGSTQAPTSEPADLDWVRIDGWAYPISETAGPGERTDAGPWSCFARTPTGAVIAAYTINLRLSFVSDFEAALEDQVVPGVGRDALLAQGQEAPGAITDTKGFVLETYSPDNAVVSLYLVQQGRNFTCSVEVQWLDGDWALRVQQDGSTASGCIEAEPPRYVPWGDD